MNCTECNGCTKVVDRRGTRRRRECVVCKHRFNTIEVLPDEVVKKVEPKVEAIKVEKPKAPPKSASKRTGQITLSAVKRNATARRKIEEMRELRSLEDSFMDPDYDYLPERW